MSMRIVPPSTAASSTPHVVSHKDTAHPTSGVHDTLRHGLPTPGGQLTASTAHPLEARLAQWESTQAQLRFNLQRTTFGLALPLRGMMDRKMCAEDGAHPQLKQAGMSLGGTSNLALEILEGRDESIDVGDFMGLHANPGEVLDITGAMEKQRKI